MSNRPGLPLRRHSAGDCQSSPFDASTALLVAFDPSRAVDGTQRVLTISGELDMATAPALEQALERASGSVVIDCRSLGFMDAAGIGVMVKALRHIESIRLTNARPIIRRVITIVGLDETFLADGASE